MTSINCNICFAVTGVFFFGSVVEVVSLLEAVGWLCMDTEFVSSLITLALDFFLPPIMPEILLLRLPKVLRFLPLDSVRDNDGCLAKGAGDDDGRNS